MKKLAWTGIVAVAAVVVSLIGLFLIGRPLIKTEEPITAEIELTVYTLTDEATEKWEKVKKVELPEATYPIVVKQVASTEELFIAVKEDGTAFGFGVSEEEVNKYNATVEPTENEKGSLFIGLEYLTFSSAKDSFVIADFDYSSESSNAQKEDAKTLYKQLYEAYKSKNK